MNKNEPSSVAGAVAVRCSALLDLVPVTDCIENEVVQIRLMASCLGSPALPAMLEQSRRIDDYTRLLSKTLCRLSRQESRRSTSRACRFAEEVRHYLLTFLRMLFVVRPYKCVQRSNSPSKNATFSDMR